MQTYLHAMITVRTRNYGGERTTGLPQVEPIIELGRNLSCPVPGMYGGFTFRWDDDAVVSESWCRIVGGSGQRHRITVHGVELLEDGFV